MLGLVRLEERDDPNPFDGNAFRRIPWGLIVAGVGFVAMAIAVAVAGFWIGGRMANGDPAPAAEANTGIGLLLEQTARNTLRIRHSGGSGLAVYRPPADPTDNAREPISTYALAWPGGIAYAAVAAGPNGVVDLPQQLDAEEIQPLEALATHRADDLVVIAHIDDVDAEPSTGPVYGTTLDEATLARTAIVSLEQALARRAP